MRREFLERVRLKFKFKTTFVEEDDEHADVGVEIDGVPVVDGLLVTITSKGRGITIEQFRCEYRSFSCDALRAITAGTHLGEHIGQGKACEGRLKIYSKPITFTSALVVDSTGKSWKCSRRGLTRLNNESVLWWSKKPFQKQESSSDKRLTEKRRAKQQEALALESAAALQSAQDHQRVTEMKRKLYNLLRRINWIEADFQFPPAAGTSFSISTIMQINRDIESIQDALVELADLPESKVVLGVAIPTPANLSASWDELGEIWKTKFLPIQATYRKVKGEVLGKD